MSDPIYKVRDWQKHFENNRSRTVENLRWVCVPNKHDGEGYAIVMEQENAAELFAAWVLILQVASKCQERGTLLREDGTPMTAGALATKTRASKTWFENALNFFTTKVKWMERQETDSQVSPACHPPVTQVTKKEGKEVNGREGKEGDLDSLAIRISKLHPDWSHFFSHPERVALAENSRKWEALTDGDWQTLTAWYAEDFENAPFKAGKHKLIESPDAELAKARKFVSLASAKKANRAHPAPENWQAAYQDIDPDPVYSDGEYCAPDWDRLSPMEREEVLKRTEVAA